MTVFDALSRLRRSVLASLVLVSLLLVPAVFAVSARAETAGTGWEAFAQVYPTVLHVGGSGTIQIAIMNVGARPSSGAITVTDTLPAGVSAVEAGGMLGSRVVSPEEEAEEKVNGVPRGGARWRCIGTQVVRCTSDPAYLKELPYGQGKTEPGYHEVERVGIAVQVGAGVPDGALENVVGVAGGGASAAARVVSGVTVGAGEAAFGFAGWDVWFSNADGSVDTQAGSHPYEATFAVGFNEDAGGVLAGGEPRNLEVELPPGFFGEPNAVPRCTREQLDSEECPADAQVGDALLARSEEHVGGSGGYLIRLPIYNVVPPAGVAAQFALKDDGKALYFDAGPRGYGRYALVTRNDNIPTIEVDSALFTFWGVPPEPSHDPARLEYSANHNQQAEECDGHGCSSSAPPRPFLTLPTSCGEPQPVTINVTSVWEHPGTTAQASLLSHNEQDVPTGFTGCFALAFNPSISFASDTSEGDTPAGLGVNVTMPQESLRVPGTLSEATIKNATVALPAGFVINPGQAAGLQACRRGDVPGGDDLPTHPGEEGEPERFEGPPDCPNASKVGTIKIKTPLLEDEAESELEGDAYVLEQSDEEPNLQSNPPTLQLLLAASGDGIDLKLVADVQLNKETGQLTTTLSRTPGLPFTSFQLQFTGGAQAALATPVQCGTYTTTSDFTSWASPFIQDAFPSSAFQITGGPDGSACVSSPLPFHPEMVAGATTDQAGGYTGFSLLLQRGDGQQRIERLQFKAPPGLSGMLSTVPLCGEPQAQEGTCSPSSQIGHTSVASGPGPYPLVLPQPGDPEFPIYLTGPYDGAPFGLSIVTPIVAGPFNLGTIVTRARIEIDPRTAQITVTTEPLPQIVDGVPTDLRLIDSVIDRPGFMFNPTNCDPSSFSGTAWGAPPPGVGGPGATAPIGSRFHVGSCQSLKFAPDFTVTASGKTSRVDGAGLTAKIVYPSTPPGNNQASSQANIASVKVELPRQLPSRLSTLQKACTAAQFDANPAGCPAASVVGHVVVHTPVLPVALEGPAYFVSNGGEAFPNLIVVLQGEGVTIDLVGDTFISRAGITSSTFKTVPDQPFQSFELTLPEGPYSALTANGNLCASTRAVTVKQRVTVRVKGRKKTVTRSVRQTTGGSLVMPTEFVGQNGATLKQNTKVQITGCAKAKLKAAKGRGRRGKGRRRAG
jgi:uncharacterized repeat protein (TIGR01451 family)